MLLHICGILMIFIGTAMIGILLGADVTLESAATPKHRRRTIIGYIVFGTMIIIGTIVILGV